MLLNLHPRRRQVKGVTISANLNKMKHDVVQILEIEKMGMKTYKENRVFRFGQMSFLQEQQDRAKAALYKRRGKSPDESIEQQ